MSTIRSAVNLLPVICSAIVFNIVSGILVPLIGYYVPSMIFATVTMSVGMGILTLLNYHSAISLVLGLQVPAGVGIGVALQQTVLAAQTILSLDDVSIGVSLIVLAQTLGGTVAISAAETIFSTSLSSSLSEAVPQLGQGSILKYGAKDFQKLVPPQYLEPVLSLYSKAVVNSWYLAVGLACCSIIGCAGMEWKRVNPTPAAEKDSGEIPVLEAIENPTAEKEQSQS